MKRFLIPAGVAIALVGCGGSNSSTPAGQPTGRVVTDNPTGWMSWADLQKVRPDSSLKIRVSDHGTDVYERSVLFRSAFEDNGNDQALVESNDVVGPEDMGSPILLNGKIVASIFASADSHHLFARSIEQQMETTRGSSPAEKLVISTTQPELAEQILKRRGLIDQYMVQPRGQEAAPASRATALQPIPGRKFAATFLSGPDASIHSISTFSLQLADGRWLATGHALGGNESRRLPVSFAYVDGRLNDGSIWAHPVGAPFGTLTADTRFGTLVDATANTAVTLPVTVKFALDGEGFEHTHQVTSDHNSNNEQIAEEMAVNTGLFNAIGNSRNAMHGDAVLTLTYADGEVITFDYNTDPDEFGVPLGGTGVDVFFSVDFWVSDKLSSLVGNGKEPATMRVDVTLTSGM